MHAIEGKVGGEPAKFASLRSIVGFKIPGLDR